MVPGMFERFVGSKGAEGIWQRIISEMPPHRVYVEAFLGSGVILRRKRPAFINVGMDIDPAVIGEWRSCNAASGDGPRAAVTVICGDARALLAAHPWAGDELVYADPPYLRSVRSCRRRYYRHEFDTAEEHESLLRVLKRLPCLVMVSGYHSPLYAHLLATWRVVEIPSVDRRGRRTVEVLWCNFPPPVALHDYRFLGRNFRERERIQRRKRRWIARLASLHPLERGALLDALEAAPPFPAMRTAPPFLAWRDPPAVSGDGCRRLSPEPEMVDAPNHHK